MILLNKQTSSKHNVNAWSKNRQGSDNQQTIIHRQNPKHKKPRTESKSRAALALKQEAWQC